MCSYKILPVSRVIQESQVRFFKALLKLVAFVYRIDQSLQVLDIFLRNVAITTQNIVHTIQWRLKQLRLSFWKANYVLKISDYCGKLMQMNISVELNLPLFSITKITKSIMTPFRSKKLVVTNISTLFKFNMMKPLSFDCRVSF